MKRYTIAVLLTLSLFVSGLPVANAETKTFPCGGAATYSVLMPDGVIEASSGSQQCTGILVIDSSVKRIGRYAFAGSRITSVNFPNSVTHIGERAFFGSNLDGPLVLGDSIVAIDKEAFASSKISSVVIPNSVRTIGSSVFYSTPLASVTFGKSVTDIGEYAFSTTKLTSVTIPDSVINIGKYAFDGSPIELLNLGSSVATIGAWAFKTTNLSSVTFPKSVVDVGYQAFYLSKLERVVISSTSINISAYALQPYFLRLPTISLPDDAVNLKSFLNGLRDNLNLNSTTTIEYCGPATREQLGTPAKIICPPERKVLIDAAKAVNELKAKQEAETKAAVAIKKTTITCIKGNLTKKVTAVKPKCPAGYKQK